MNHAHSYLIVVSTFNFIDYFEWFFVLSSPRYVVLPTSTKPNLHIQILLSLQLTPFLFVVVFASLGHSLRLVRRAQRER